MICKSFLYFLQEAPGSIILDAFKNECQSRNEDWKSLKSQVWAVRFFIRHPLIKQYPPKEQVLNSFLKLYIREVEEHYLAKRSKELAPVAEGCSEGNDEELFHPDLLAAHVNSFLSRNENESTMCYKSFVNYYASRSEAVLSASPQAKKCLNPLVGQPSSTVSESAITASYNNATLGENEENQEPLSSLMSTRKSSFDCSYSSMSSAHCFASYAPLWAAESLSYVWNTLRVARNTFQNVGLSLWPAAFALAQLLSQEFCGDSGIIDCIKTAGTIAPKLRIVELGAGAGLTPCVLAAQRGFQEKVSCFCATDYQIELIENMRKNFWMNGVHDDEKVKECERGVTTEEDKIPVQNSAATIGTSSLRSPVQHEPQEAAMRRSAAHKENSENAVGERRKNEVEGQEVENKSCSSECTTVKFSLKLLDWNEQFNCDSFFRTHGCDLVLGADCIYDVSVIPALATVIHSAVTSTTTSFFSGTSSCAVLVQTHRQASTMKVFFDHIRAYHMSVKSYRVHLIPKEEAEKRCRPLSTSPSFPTSKFCIPLGNWEHVFSSCSTVTKNDTYFSPSAKVCVLVPDEVLLNGNFRSQEATGNANYASLDSRTRCSDGIEDGWIGAYFVSMVGILGVHIITASEGKEETKNV